VPLRERLRSQNDLINAHLPVRRIDIVTICIANVVRFLSEETSRKPGSHETALGRAFFRLALARRFARLTVWKRFATLHRSAVSATEIHGQSLYTCLSRAHKPNGEDRIVKPTMNDYRLCSFVPVEAIDEHGCFGMNSWLMSMSWNNY
jgi:hypothetical protein